MTLIAEGISVAFDDHPVLNAVDLALAPGEVLGLIGRSGCGKSTLAKVLAGLVVADAGRVTPADGRGVQYMWQDPHSALSPYLGALDAVAEALEPSGRALNHRRERAGALLTRMGLSPDRFGLRPHQLSGGQAQRVTLARALAAEPAHLILDEPLTALDLVTQERLVHLLRDLAGAGGPAMLIISHDLQCLAHLCTRIALLEQGRIVEDLPTADFFTGCRHPVSRAFVALARD